MNIELLEMGKIIQLSAVLLKWLLTSKRYSYFKVTL